jgi:hypothetical protein
MFWPEDALISVSVQTPNDNILQLRLAVVWAPAAHLCSAPTTVGWVHPDAADCPVLLPQSHTQFLTTPPPWQMRGAFLRLFLGGSDAHVEILLDEELHRLQLHTFHSQLQTFQRTRFRGDRISALLGVVFLTDGRGATRVAFILGM